MNGFDPSQPCQPFLPESDSRRRRSGAQLVFVEQGGQRFVVKSYSEQEGDPDASAQRLQRELQAIEAFSALGVQVLQPVFGPVARLELRLENDALLLHHVLVFPFHDRRTLLDVLRHSPDPLPVIREAARRIGERHRRARAVCEIHSDGAPHNIFEDWTWFDLGEAPQTQDLREAKACEVWRFLTGVIDVTPLGQARARVAVFCEAYGDRDILQLACELRKRPYPLLRILAQPYQVLRLALGKSSKLGRLRTWRELRHHLERTPLKDGQGQSPRPS